MTEYEARASDVGHFVTIDGHPVFIGDRDSLAKTITEKLNYEGKTVPAKVVVRRGGEKAATVWASNFDKLPEDVKNIYRDSRLVRTVVFAKSDPLKGQDIEAGHKAAARYTSVGKRVSFYEGSVESGRGRFGENWNREVSVHEAGHAVAFRVTTAVKTTTGETMRVTLQERFTNEYWQAGPTPGGRGEIRDSPVLSKGMPPSNYGNKNAREDFAESWAAHHLAPWALGRASGSRSEFMAQVQVGVEKYLAQRQKRSADVGDQDLLAALRLDGPGAPDVVSRTDEGPVWVTKDGHTFCVEGCEDLHPKALKDETGRILGVAYPPGKWEQVVGTRLGNHVFNGLYDPTTGRMYVTVEQSYGGKAGQPAHDSHSDLALAAAGGHYPTANALEDRSLHVGANRTRDVSLYGFAGPLADRHLEAAARKFAQLVEGHAKTQEIHVQYQSGDRTYHSWNELATSGRTLGLVPLQTRADDGEGAWVTIHNHHVFIDAHASEGTKAAKTANEAFKHFPFKKDPDSERFLNGKVITEMHNMGISDAKIDFIATKFYMYSIGWTGDMEQHEIAKFMQSPDGQKYHDAMVKAVEKTIGSKYITLYRGYSSEKATELIGRARGRGVTQITLDNGKYASSWTSSMKIAGLFGIGGQKGFSWEADWHKGMTNVVSKTFAVKDIMFTGLHAPGWGPRGIFRGNEFIIAPGWKGRVNLVRLPSEKKRDVGENYWTYVVEPEESSFANSIVAKAKKRSIEDTRNWPDDVKKTYLDHVFGPTEVELFLPGGER